MINSHQQPARIKSRNSLLKLSEAKEMSAPTHRRPRQDRLCWSFSSALSPFLWFMARFGWWSSTASSQPTLDSYLQTYPNLCRSPTLNWASLKKNLRERFLLWTSVHGQMEEYFHWKGALALQLCGFVQSSTDELLFVSPLECRALPGKFTSPATLWSALKNESFHSKRF